MASAVVVSGKSKSPARRRKASPRRRPAWDSRVQFPSAGNEIRHSTYRAYFVNEGMLTSYDEFKEVAKRRQKLLLNALSNQRDPMFRQPKKERGWDNRASVSCVSNHNNELHPSQREFFDAPRQLYSDGTHEPRFIVDEFGHRTYNLNYGQSAQKGIHNTARATSVTGAGSGTGGGARRLPPLSSLTLPNFAHAEFMAGAAGGGAGNDRMAFTERVPPPPQFLRPIPPPKSSAAPVMSPPAAAGSQSARSPAGGGGSEFVNGRRVAGRSAAAPAPASPQQQAASAPVAAAVPSLPGSVQVIFSLSSRSDVAADMISASRVRSDQLQRLIVRAYQKPGNTKNWFLINAADVLRDEVKRAAAATADPSGAKAIETALASGSLVPSDLVVSLLHAAMAKAAAASGGGAAGAVFVVSGFPRSRADYNAWKAHTETGKCTVRAVLYFKATRQSPNEPVADEAHPQRGQTFGAQTVPLLAEWNDSGLLDVIDSSPDRAPDAIAADTENYIAKLQPPL